MKRLRCTHPTEPRFGITMAWKRQIISVWNINRQPCKIWWLVVYWILVLIKKISVLNSLCRKAWNTSTSHVMNQLPQFLIHMNLKPHYDGNIREDDAGIKVTGSNHSLREQQRNFSCKEKRQPEPRVRWCSIQHQTVGFVSDVISCMWVLQWAHCYWKRSLSLLNHHKDAWTNYKREVHTLLMSVSVWLLWTAGHA